MTGGCGSLRYIAPENYANKPYNLSADVYSLSIIIWEILSIKRAYMNMTVDMVKERVIKTHERPPIDEGKWGPAVTHMLRHGWHFDPKSRPSAGAIKRILKSELLKPSTQRRSSMVLTTTKTTTTISHHEVVEEEQIEPAIVRALPAKLSNVGRRRKTMEM